MIQEGIQSVNLSKIRSGAGDKPTANVAAENTLETIFKKRYKIRLGSQIRTDHGVFYPQAVYNNLLFELTLSPASQVVRGSDATRLKYKLKNIQLEYEMMRSKTLAEEANSVYLMGGGGVLVRPCSARRGRADRESHGHAGEPADQPPEMVVERHPSPLHRAVHSRHPRIGKIFQPRPDKDIRHDQRVAQHAVQQRDLFPRFLERDQPLFPEKVRQKAKRHALPGCDHVLHGR